MCKILFRGKRIDNGKWVYGYYVFKRKRSGCFGQTISNNDFDRHYIITPRGEIFEVSPTTVCQYTGLTDKNGTKMIFENDIIKNDWCFMKGDSVIRFGEYKPFNMGDDYRQGHLGFYVEALSESEKKLYRKDILYYADKCEIIGNVFDNPELLKG